MVFDCITKISIPFPFSEKKLNFKIFMIYEFFFIEYIEFLFLDRHEESLVYFSLSLRFLFDGWNDLWRAYFYVLNVLN